MPTLWRIGEEAIGWSADDMSGKGAAHTGGRWNSQGRSAVYSAGSIALACLETLVHIKIDLPLNRYLVRIDVPDTLWRSCETLASPLPIGWDAEPYGMTSVALGDDWISRGTSALLEVPSVIVPEEYNYLINPAHPEATQIRAHKMRKWIYSARLRLLGAM